MQRRRHNDLEVVRAQDTSGTVLIALHALSLDFYLYHSQAKQTTVDITTQKSRLHKKDGY
jgi:hypothetical protein